MCSIDNCSSIMKFTVTMDRDEDRAWIAECSYGQRW